MSVVLSDWGCNQFLPSLDEEKKEGRRETLFGSHLWVYVISP